MVLVSITLPFYTDNKHVEMLKNMMCMKNVEPQKFKKNALNVLKVLHAHIPKKAALCIISPILYKKSDSCRIGKVIAMEILENM